MAKGFQTQIIGSIEDIQEKLLSDVEEVEDPRANRTKKHPLTFLF